MLSGHMRCRPTRQLLRQSLNELSSNKEQLRVFFPPFFASIKQSGSLFKCRICFLRQQSQPPPSTPSCSALLLGWVKPLKDEPGHNLWLTWIAATSCDPLCRCDLWMPFSVRYNPLDSWSKWNGFRIKTDTRQKINKWRLCPCSFPSRTTCSSRSSTPSRPSSWTPSTPCAAGSRRSSSSRSRRPWGRCLRPKSSDTSRSANNWWWSFSSDDAGDSYCGLCVIPASPRLNCCSALYVTQKTFLEWSQKYHDCGEMGEKRGRA